jgi:hypothetical protein
MANVYVKEHQYFYPNKIWVRDSCRQAGIAGIKNVFICLIYIKQKPALSQTKQVYLCE